MSTADPETPKRVFKVAAGQRSRDFTTNFLAGDFAALGPGSVGDWRENSDRSNEELGISKADRTSLNTLSAIQKDDLIVLTIGFDVMAVGRPESGYNYQPDGQLFGGWDLNHFLRVKWANVDDVRAKTGLEPPGELKITRRTAALSAGSEGVINWAREADAALEEAGHWEEAELLHLSLEDPKSKLENLESFNALDETRQADIHDICERACRLRAAIEARDWNPRSSENEMVALLVVPFLLALGWEPEQIGLEWNRIDVALFGPDDSHRENPLLIVEAKAPLVGLDWALGQAGDYAQRHKPGCPIITSDGFSWVIFENPLENPTQTASIYLQDIRESANGFFSTLIDLDLIPSKPQA